MMRLEDIYADFQNSFDKIGFLQGLKADGIESNYNIKIDRLIKAWERKLG